jgi:hypothetical protein
MAIFPPNCASRFEAKKTVNGEKDNGLYPWRVASWRRGESPRGVTTVPGGTADAGGGTSRGCMLAGAPSSRSALVPRCSPSLHAFSSILSKCEQVRFFKSAGKMNFGLILLLVLLPTTVRYKHHPIAPTEAESASRP